MRKILLFLILAVFTSGCATANSINRSYSKVNHEDGISMKEAKIIAKKVLMESDANGKYQFTYPHILNNENTYPHQSFWFVSFSKKKYDFTKSKYIVVVHKKSGEVQYSAKNFPSNVQGYRFMVELDAPILEWQEPDQITKK